MKEKATIFDFVRMCAAHVNGCKECEIYKRSGGCLHFVRGHIDEASEIILKWCKEHPIKTRQSEFLQMFPNVELIDDEVINICPNVIDVQYGANCKKLTCKECRKKYWLAEVEENE